MHTHTHTVCVSGLAQPSENLFSVTGAGQFARLRRLAQAETRSQRPRLQNDQNTLGHRGSRWVGGSWCSSVCRLALKIQNGSKAKTSEKFNNKQAPFTERVPTHS